MRLRIKNLRPSQNNKLLTFLLLLVITTLQAQEVVIDSTNVIQNEIPTSLSEKDTVKTFKGPSGFQDLF